MKGLVKFARGKGNVELREVAEPSPGPDQVKIEVKAAGICGSDIHILHDQIVQPIHPPFVMGHEFCGVVTEIGPEVTAWENGDRVTAEPAFSVCERCDYCRTGQYHMCWERKGFGFWHDGAFAKYIVVPEKRVHRLPVAVDFIAGALCEPLAVATHSVIELTAIKPTDWVLVTGVGAIGLLVAQVARLKGGRVVLAGVTADRKRFQIAETLGFHDCLDVQKHSLQDCARAKTGGKGFDVILECSGSPEAVREGLAAIKKRGIFTQIGLFGKPFELNFETIAFKEITLQGSISHPWRAWDAAIRLLESGTVQTRPLVTDVFSLERWQEAFQKFENKEGTKILLIPGE
ncbi:MAG: Alcohol dehydrogenase GroES domain protein [Deltaproteobacteria bacterium]|nr:Alcohol dehydrogenase GroES domain protein [Deltaproteobacteria bacterium]MBP1717203.1 Alcohol dehydrogenase GroES domain protein [Deltaproteobacteria bacterium]